MQIYNNITIWFLESPQFIVVDICSILMTEQREGAGNAVFQPKHNRISWTKEVIHM